jgi:hypothetical protein
MRVGGGVGAAPADVKRSKRTSKQIYMLKKRGNMKSDSLMRLIYEIMIEILLNNKALSI